MVATLPEKLLFQEFYLISVEYVCFFVAVEYAQIDWHDFVLVETIDFRESETGAEDTVCVVRCCRRS